MIKANKLAVAVCSTLCDGSASRLLCARRLHTSTSSVPWQVLLSITSTTNQAATVE
jgi:hypothetical protein